VAFGFYELRHDNNAAAMDQFEQAIERSSDSLAEAQYGYGDVLYKTAASNSDIETSIVHFRRALELNPDLFEADHALASAYAELGQTDRALYYQQRANSVAEKMRSTFAPHAEGSLN